MRRVQMTPTTLTMTTGEGATRPPSVTPGDTVEEGAEEGEEQGATTQEMQEADTDPEYTMKGK